MVALGFDIALALRGNLEENAALKKSGAALSDSETPGLEPGMVEITVDQAQQMEEPLRF